MTCFLFNQSPETHKSWTLAVFAVNEKDARDYIEHFHPGMRLAGKIDSGNVNASCGAVTEKQLEANRAQLDRNGD